jgi:Pyruvate/2-oxoacid:ferredoxin oxidoreductase gamma subunit
VEREVMLTGIGGQGVQLAAQVLARAAMREGRFVLLFGSYGGTMRGGSTDATVVIADSPVSAPPIVSKLWAAVAVHHAFFEPLRRKLRPGALVVCDPSLFEGELDRSRQRVCEVPAGALAAAAGSALAVSLVLVGALAGLTGLAAADSLALAMRESLPPYRQQHAEANERALRAGYASVPAGSHPAWAAAEHAA